MKKLFLTTIAALSTFVCTTQAQELHQPVQDPTYLVKPSGQYSVGYHDLFWVNGTLDSNGQYECPNNQDPYYTGQNKDDFAPDNQTDFCREVVLRIYYPTQKNNEVGNAYTGVNQFDVNYLINALPDNQFPPEKKKQLIDGLVLKSYTIENKPIINNKKFPLLFFTPGFEGNVEMYENSITHLVSHGYVVIGINNLFVNGFAALENGHIVPSTTDYSQQSRLQMRDYMQKNEEFVYNNITNNLPIITKDNFYQNISSSFDLSNIGIYGHSIGGIAASDMVLAHPTWFKAVSPLDGASDVKPGFPSRNVYPIPVLHQMSIFMRYEWMQGDPWNCGDNSLVNLDNDGYLVLYEKDVPPGVKVDENYSAHLNFTDFGTTQYQPSLIDAFKYENASLRELGTVDGWKFTNHMNKYLLNFFDTYLKKGDKIGPDFSLCQPLTKNSKLICGPASGV